MHKYLVYSAFGWLALSGLLHFAIDVVSQHLRGRRPPGLATTLYYGLNSAFSVGQVAFGLFGLFIAWRALPLLSEVPVLVLSLAAGLAWLATTMLFMEYWEPRVNMGIFCLLVVAALLTRNSGANAL